MLKVLAENIPDELKALRQWVGWKLTGGRKLPVQTNGRAAKSNDPSTWASFAEVMAAYEQGRFYPGGVGFVFTKDDPYCGIDLDGCLHPQDGLDDWAQKIVDRLDSYTEVSPSGYGVKIIVRGRSPFVSGKKIPLQQFGGSGGKEAAIEIYNGGRYFALTGQLLGGTER